MKQNIRRWLLVGLAVLLGALLCFWGGWAAASKVAQERLLAYNDAQKLFAHLDLYEQQVTYSQWTLENDPQGLWFQNLSQNTNWGITPFDSSPLHQLSDELYQFVKASYFQFQNVGKAYEAGDPNLPDMLQRTARYCEVGQEVLDYLDPQWRVMYEEYDGLHTVGENLRENMLIPAEEKPRFADPVFYTIQQEVEALIPDDLWNTMP